MAISPRAQSLMRAQDTVPTTYVMPITPKNWRIRSTTTVPIVDANPADPKPRYLQADYIGGVKSSDNSQATANVTVADADGSSNEADYTPRTQPAKATQLGTVLVTDIGRGSQGTGWIGPRDPYSAPPASPAGDPTLTTLTPATAVAGAATPQFAVKLTGTNFTVYSQVRMGGTPAPTSSVQYISPTEIRVQMSPASSVAGTTTITVTDHGITTASKTFTWT